SIVRRKEKMEKAHLRSIYDEIGPEIIEEVVNAFYPKVYSDPDLIPIFDTVDIDEIMRKQKFFLTQFTGGPALYSREYGRPAMRYRHLPHEITPKRAYSWLRSRKEALDETGVYERPAGDDFYKRLTKVAAFMVNTEDAAK